MGHQTRGAPKKGETRNVTKPVVDVHPGPAFQHFLVHRGDITRRRSLDRFPDGDRGSQRLDLEIGLLTRGQTGNEQHQKQERKQKHSSGREEPANRLIPVRLLPPAILLTIVARLSCGRISRRRPRASDHSFPPGAGRRKTARILGKEVAPPYSGGEGSETPPRGFPRWKSKRWRNRSESRRAARKAATRLPRTVAPRARKRQCHAAASRLRPGRTRSALASDRPG